MKRTELLVAGLTIAVILETSALAYPLLQSLSAKPEEHRVGNPENYAFNFRLFNKPISNNTDQEFSTVYNGSWIIVIRNSLAASGGGEQTEAEMAFAPDSPVEAKSIPTLIVQERADGLLRVEYFAQSWPNTYGLVLYNSTSPSWEDGANVTIQFVSLGPPSVIDPQIAPRSNGNLTMTIAGQVVLSNYPIAWASLAGVYLYGLPGSSFTGGNVTLVVQGETPG